ncbi:hypothetical protein [Alteromonas halophila]|nr:hypothetical protein [Alteromonas halophila]
MVTMQLARTFLLVILTFSLSLQVIAAGNDTVCHHEHMNQAVMADMQSDCHENDMAVQPPCCENDCQCDSHLLHSSAFIADDSELAVRLNLCLRVFMPYLRRYGYLISPITVLRGTPKPC